MSQCILTNYGLEEITRAISQGSTITISGMKVGSSNDFTLDPTMTTIPDIVFSSTDPTNIQSILMDINVMEVRCYLGTTIGTFNIGCVGIYDDNDSLLMVGKFDDLFEKKATTSESVGNTLQFIMPINVDNIAEGAVITQLQYDIDNTTIKLNQENQLSCQIVPHHVFDVFQSASTKTPPGAFPLWTGEIVNCDGVREEFWTEINARMNAGTVRVISEADWQSEVSSNGWTDGFVVNSSLKTVRLPKLKGILYVGNPSEIVRNIKAGNGSNYQICQMPVFIQVETCAVPATMAQCNAFSDLMRDYITHFQDFDGLYVKLAGTNTASSTNTWTGLNTFTQTIQGVALRAEYADLAEYYKSDKKYPAGTLITFGGDKEITAANREVNGVISTNPGLTIGCSEEDDVLPVALAGKVPVRVRGSVKKFDKIILDPSRTGIAKAVGIELEGKSYLPEEVIGIALESKEAGYDEENLVMCVTKFKF